MEEARPAWAREVDELVERRARAAKFDLAFLPRWLAQWILSPRAAAVFFVSAAAGLAAGWSLSNGAAAEQPIANQRGRSGPQLGETGLQFIEFAAPDMAGQTATIQPVANKAQPAGLSAFDEEGDAADSAPAVGESPPAAQTAPLARPSVPAVAVPRGPTISPVMLEAVSDLPPPTVAPTRERQSDRPSLTAFDTPPGLLNANQVRELIRRYHPQILKDVGIGGSVEMWIHVDESGAVARHEVKTSSGHDLLDAAAGRVVNQMRFSPAKNRDQAMAVWVRQLLTFPSGS